MLTADFDYLLPDELIAQSPADPRDSCRLLVLHKDTGEIEHRHFRDILEYLKPLDLMVANDTKVLPARLLGQKVNTGARVELLLLKVLDDGKPNAQLWEALVKPGKRLKPGAEVEFDGLRAQIEDWGSSAAGSRQVLLTSTGQLSVSQVLHQVGEIPLPPYITDYHGDRGLYQTVYSQQENSAAAPTAGLHFTKQLIKEIIDKGVNFSTVCLEVGLDTFRKVSEANIEDHQIHTEKYSVSESVVNSVNAARQNGGKIIAVGTTSVRSLESAYDNQTARLMPQTRQNTALYITPGYQFKLVDALITNFHTPRSTLMMLVSALAGREQIINAYKQAVRHEYRFLSFGDAMLII
jgi:S-adenosylmethionine:tRNA ribosyltransferase-isomerase